jgi:hypothetical protein
MRIKFLVPLFLAGASSIAMARPYARHEFRPTYSQQVQQQTSDRPYGYQVDSSFDGFSVRTYAYGANPRQANIARADWMLFADGVSLRNRAATVSLGGRRLDAIELQATRGDSFIQTVLVDLEDGRRLTITPQRQLDVEHAPNLRIDLGRGIHCGVRAVTVVGQENGWSAFRVIAG